MRRSVRRGWWLGAGASFAWAAVVCVAVACGGSSSETPWPAEPVGPAAAPRGEAADRANGGPKAAAGETEDETPASDGGL